jgi:hypothetical protein
MQNKKTGTCLKQQDPHILLFQELIVICVELACNLFWRTACSRSGDWM